MKYLKSTIEKQEKEVSTTELNEGKFRFKDKVKEL
jgi:hypothetical protein